MPRLASFVCLVVLLIAIAGCNSRPVAISGTVTHAGEKLTWPDGGYLLVVFTPENAAMTSVPYSATTDTATSTYKIATIPPGR